MSFDLKIINGDLALGSTNDLAKVEGTTKLIQDVIKIIFTQIGANPFHPWYGCPITSSLIGRALEENFVSNMATTQLQASLTRLQTLQKEQLKTNQAVSGEEQLAAIQNVSVQRSDVDPRFYRIFLTILSKSLRRIDIPLEIPII